MNRRHESPGVVRLPIASTTAHKISKMFKWLAGLCAMTIGTRVLVLNRLMPNKMGSRSEGEEGEKREKERKGKKKEKRRKKTLRSPPILCLVLCGAVRSCPCGHNLRREEYHETRQWKCSPRGVSPLPPDRLFPFSPFSPFFFSLFRAPLLVPVPYYTIRYS